MSHSWVIQHELWGLFNCSWMWSSTEMCYLFVLISTHSEGNWEREVSVTSWGQVHEQYGPKKKKVVYFLLVKLREKYLQLTRGAVMIQVQSVCILFPVAKYWLSSMAADGERWTQAVLEGMSERTSDIWSFLSPVDLVATSSCLIRTSRGFWSILPLKPLLLCSASDPSFAAVPRMREHVLCRICRFCTTYCSLYILPGSSICASCKRDMRLLLFKMCAFTAPQP